MSAKVFAFVSGKGGVGKTMLAVAFATELAKCGRTLLVDLDFFNRGLTGLLSGGDKLAEFDPPKFLSAASAEGNLGASNSRNSAEHNRAKPETGEEKPTKWAITNPSNNLYNVEYPDLSAQEMRASDLAEIDDLAISLRRLLNECERLIGAEFIVLDCHGGPDTVSFAACLVSQLTFLISEPDKITFYGTLNFIRRLDEVAGGNSYDLRLVFNKVVPAFSTLYLERLYHKEIRQLFEDKPLAGVYPLELYLTKEFEKTPFLTRVYPRSLLARKTKNIIYDVVRPAIGVPMSSEIANLGKLQRAMTRYSLGKTLTPLNINVILPIIAVVLMTNGALIFFSGRLILIVKSLGIMTELAENKIQEGMFTIVGVLSAIGFVWFLIALLLDWAVTLDRSMIYRFRMNRALEGLMLALVASGNALLLMAGLTGIFVGGVFVVLNIIVVPLGGLKFRDIINLVIAAGLIMTMLTAAVKIRETRDAIGIWRDDGAILEGGIRILLSVVYITVPLIISYLSFDY